MSKFNAGQSFADGDTVTGAKLNNIAGLLDIYTGLISEQTAMVATVSTADQLLIADTDSGDSGAANRVTVQKLLSDSFTNGTFTNFNLTGKVTTGTGTAAAPAIVPTSDTNTGIFFPAADTIAFSEGGAEAMRINSSGNVSIGTTSPAAGVRLDVVGGRSNFSAASEQYGIGVRHVSTGGPVYFGAASSSATPDAVISAAGGAALMTLQNGGNVGIGTDSPTTKLNVYDAANATLQMQGDASAQVNVIRSSTDNGSGNINLRKYRGSTASPAAVASADSLGGLNFQAFGGTNVRTLSRVIGNVDTYVSDSDISSNLTFLTSTAGGISASEKMRIDGSGNVSIGTATALSKLHVHGDLTMSNATTAITASTSTITPPATVAGYLTVSINGTSRKIAYYAT